LFTYDPFGNITKAGTGTFNPNYVFVNANNAITNQYYSIPGVAVSYDKNGNLLTDNLNTYTWDPNWGKMLSVNTGSVAVSATYDALGRMVEQYNGSTYTEILYSPIGKTALLNGSTLTKAFIPLPGGGTAIYNSTSGSPVYYRHADWLGSSRLTSTASRGLYSSQAYSPFGESYQTAGASGATSSAVDPNFTGQNSDAVPSLYDFSFREYCPSQGRWISPDPAGLAAVDPTNPQSWNRYAYVMNDPMIFVDPLGLGIQCADVLYVHTEGGEIVSTEVVDYCWDEEGGPTGGGPSGGGSNPQAKRPKPCVLNLNLSTVGGGPAFGGIGLADYLNQIFSPANVQVSINSGAPADYTLTDASGLLAQIVAPSEALGPGINGYTNNYPGGALNSGYIFSGTIGSLIDSSGGSYSLAYDRIAAHEMSHFLLQSPDLPFPGEGVLSYGPDAGNPNTNRFLPTPDQLQAIKQMCAKLHPGGI
jgi:RHS repeat-associated protein